ncbi:hypothetical protein T484DRAFT_1836024 [Baffinella frigidus]|nr:hypothetical protein T484DRAFT_1836024 [Cryptophyta sp. CCMP2293]
MFSLVHGLVSGYCQKREVRLLLLGLDGAGKTSLLERIKLEFGDSAPDEEQSPLQQLQQLRKVTPTVGLNIARADIRGTSVLVRHTRNPPIVLNLWKIIDLLSP